MKNAITMVVFCFLFAFQLNAQRTSVTYHQKDHTLSANVSNVPISKLIDVLAKQDLQLYILGKKQDFKVSGTFSKVPVDGALAKLMPSGIQYFYKVDAANAEETMMAQAKKAKSKTLVRQTLISKQKGDKNMRLDAGKSKLKVANQLLTVKTPLRLTINRRLKDPLQPKNVVFKGSTAMASVSKTTPVVEARLKKNDQIVNLNLGTTLQLNKEKHLVVTYKVTANGMTPVSVTELSGKYVPKTEAAGDRAIVGIENGKTVLAETFEDPLTYRSIYQPGKSDHKEFTADEAYVTVEMPIKYKKALNSKKLEMKMVRFKDVSKANSVLKQVKAKQLRSTDLNKSFEILRTAPKADFSRLKKTIKIN